MGQMSIGDAIKQVLESNGWKQRMLQIRMRTDWEKIVGKTIAKYTQEVHLYNRILTITTTVAPLKQELRYAKDQLIQSINQHFGEAVVKEIQIK